MSVITGLKNIRAKIEGPANDGPKARWLKLNDGQSVKIRFINEFDPDSPHYDPKRGLAIVVSEHTNPTDFRRKAACTMDDEGRCFGCEQHRKDPRAGWRPKLRFYVNVLVNDGEEEYVAVWSQGVGPKATVTNMLIEYADDSGSISNLQWRLKRTGTGTGTNYTLIPLAPDAVDFDWSAVEPYALQEVAVREITYNDQEAFYMGVEVQQETTASSEW